ncbi:MAG: ribonuclease HII [Lentisphaeria bacterium]|nr:ribonuclease HII [Lentisphaeria bacterium]
MKTNQLPSEMLLPELEAMNNHSSPIIIAGIDEAGRGPIAGPVVAAAVILHDHKNLPPFFDSKQLTHQKRAELLAELKNHPAIEYGIGVVEVSDIDTLNILGATFEAMRRAVRTLKQVDYLLVDGNKIIPGLSCEQSAIVKGDARSASIAAASIIAKEYRDEIMRQYDLIYPGYGFAEHMGYGTKFHLDALKKLGITPIHRRSFGPVRDIITPPPRQIDFDF